jgi:hypothetical protein
LGIFPTVGNFLSLLAAIPTQSRLVLTSGPGLTFAQLNGAEGTMTRELIKGDAETLILKLRAAIDEGSVRRVLVKHNGRTVAAFPLMTGVIGTVVARTLAAIGIVAVLKDCTLEIERNSDVSEDLPEAKAS